MIIPAKSQFNWLSGFWQEDFFKFQPTRTHYGPWQPCWISNQHQKHKSGRGPSSEHFWQVWLISVLRFQRRRFKCEKLTDGRTNGRTDGRTTDAYPWQKLTWPMARWAKNRKKTTKSNPPPQIPIILSENRKISEANRYNFSRTHAGTNTSIKSDEVKLILGTQTSSCNEMIRWWKCYPHIGRVYKIGRVAL